MKRSKTTDNLLNAIDSMLNWFDPICLRFESSDCLNKAGKPCVPCMLRKAAREFEKELKNDHK